MQAIKNALGSHHNEEGARGHPLGTSSEGKPGPTGVTGAARTGAEDLTHDTTRSHTSGSGLTGSGVTGTHSSSSTGYDTTSPTNASATRSTGNALDSTSSNVNTGSGRSTAGLSHLDHTEGHDRSIANKFDPTGANVTHDHKHLGHVTHADHRHVEVEEVERQREVDRHVHHVQHHVQPVIDKQVKDEVHHTNAVPVTEIKEKHSSTGEDRNLLAGLAAQHKDTTTHREKERTVVDLGERVHENVSHHVHHITQPVIEQEVVDRHRIHTVVPIHHTTHEAPVIHKSSTHEPVTLDSFVKGGGKLGSGITPDTAGVLNEGNCDRTVDGPAETLIEKLHLGTGHHGSSTTGTTSTTGSSVAGLGSGTGTRGTGVGGEYVSNDGVRHHTKAGQAADNATDRNTSGKYQSNDGDLHGSKIAAKVDDMTPSNNRVGSTNM